MSVLTGAYSKSRCKAAKLMPVPRAKRFKSSSRSVALSASRTIESASRTKSRFSSVLFKSYLRSTLNSLKSMSGMAF